MAPMLAAVVDSSGNAQINFQVPLELNASSILNQQYTGTLSACNASLTTFPTSSGWGGFFAGANGFVVAQHASDYSLVTAQNPAHPGEAIVTYADDFFPVWPPPSIAFPVPNQPLFRILPKSLVTELYFAGGGYLYLQTYPQPICIPGNGCNNSYADTPALQVTFEGLAPGMIGVEQINFVVPASQQPGNWALFFNIGSCPSGTGAPGSCGLFGSSSPKVILPVQ
jgi:hypothetical protein